MKRAVFVRAVPAAALAALIVAGLRPGSQLPAQSSDLGWSSIAESARAMARTLVRQYPGAVSEATRQNLEAELREMGAIRAERYRLLGVRAAISDAEFQTRMNDADGRFGDTARKLAGILRGEPD